MAAMRLPMDVELADLRQAVAERIEPRRLRLQLAELDRERVEIALRVLVEQRELFAFGRNRGAQLGDFMQIASARTGEEDRRGEACGQQRERRAAENAGGQQTAARRVEVHARWCCVRLPDDNDVHRF